MIVEDLLSPGLRDLRPAAFDPWSVADGLLEAQVLDVRVEALRSLVGVLLEGRTAMHFDSNAALVVAHAVTSMVWEAESRSTPLTAWNIVGSRIEHRDGQLSLSITCMPRATLRVVCDELRFYSFHDPSLTAAIPDYTAIDSTPLAVVRWGSTASAPSVASISAESLTIDVDEAPTTGETFAQPVGLASLHRSEPQLSTGSSSDLDLVRLDEGLFQVSSGAFGGDAVFLADTPTFLDEYDRRGSTLFFDRSQRWQLSRQRRDDKKEVLVEFLSRRLAFDWFYRFSAGFGLSPDGFVNGAVSRTGIDALEGSLMSQVPVEPSQGFVALGRSRFLRLQGLEGRFELPGPASAGVDWVQGLVGTGALLFQRRSTVDPELEGLDWSVNGDRLAWRLAQGPSYAEIVPPLSGRVDLTGSSEIENGEAFFPVATFALANGSELLAWELGGAPGIESVKLLEPTHLPHIAQTSDGFDRGLLEAEIAVANRALRLSSVPDRVEVDERNGLLTINLGKRGFGLRSDGLWFATHTYGPGQLISGNENALAALCESAFPRRRLAVSSASASGGTAFERTAARLAAEVHDDGNGRASIGPDGAAFESALGAVHVRPGPWLDIHRVSQTSDPVFVTRSRRAVDLMRVARSLVVARANYSHMAG